MNPFQQNQKPIPDAENTPGPGPPPHHSNEKPLSDEQPNDHHHTPITINPEGHSGRRGIHPIKFFTILWRSSSDASRLCNILWPVVPVALAVRYAKSDRHLAIFILNYIAMVPCANTIGFAGREFARKIPKVIGILAEIGLAAVIELILFVVLLTRDQFLVIKSAILGSILATLLLCLGLCFFAGGLRRDEQEFSETVSEVGSGLLLTAFVSLAMAL